MPIQLWSDDDLCKAQRHGRYVQASARIKESDAAIAELLRLLDESEYSIMVLMPPTDRNLACEVTYDKIRAKLKEFRNE